MFRRMLSAPRRLGRRRGFGIHSPFGYRFVRTVLAQPNGYYAYASLGGRQRRRLRLLYRLVLFFKPGRIDVSGEVCGEHLRAMEMAVAHCGTEATGELAAIGANATPADIDRAVVAGIPVVFTSLPSTRALMERLWDSTDRGMLFVGSQMAVYVALRHLPHQRFDIWL